MKYVKLFEEHINEFKIFKYKESYSTADQSIYYFKADDLNYEVDVWHDSRKHELGEYEAEFRVSGQKHAGHSTGKDLKHLNSVLYTVGEIVEIVVKEKKIKKVKLEGAGGERDKGGEGIFGAMNATTRTKMYLRFLGQKYSKKAIKSVGRYIYVDMTIAYPELFTDEGKSKSDELLDLLNKISDGEPDRAGIKRVFNGTDDDNFSVDTDFVYNNKLGTIYFVIDVQKTYNEYSVEWDAYDADDSGTEYFKNFDEIITFLKKKFL